ncbi:MAG: hypothetical protein RIS76_820 [Verrucomicrobiota bacterium]
MFRATWLGLGSLFLAFGLFEGLAEAQEKRSLWTNTRLVGSPEPPSPYVVEKVFGHLKWQSPLYVAPEPGTPDLWVVLQGGDKDRPSKIVRLQNRADAPEPETILQMDGRLVYGLTFHPGYRTNGWVYLFSNGPTGSETRTNRISRYTVPKEGTGMGFPTNEVAILSLFSAGHDGGDLAFGNDGMLYVTTGDGSSDSDTYDSGQDMSRLLAKLLRIDVDRPGRGLAYGVPSDNPFVGREGMRPETWAFGFRNPWRMGIDDKTGDIWVGQNGQDLWETAHLVKRGDNIGWSVFEGSRPFHAQRKRGPTPIVAPTIEHSHSEFRSLTGGVVYYGEELRELNGAYVYGDYSTGRIWGARHQDGKTTWNEELADTSLQIAAFRVDGKGRLLVVDHGGGIYRLIKRSEAEAGPKKKDPVGHFPRKLSETGLFVSTRDHRPDPGLIPYSVRASGWADGAEAERFLALPGSEKIAYTTSRGWEVPNGGAVVQTLSLPAANGDPAMQLRIETRVLLRQENEWVGYSYRWNDDQSDAELVAKEGATVEMPMGAVAGAERARTWHIPSRAECMTCHSRAVNFVLGLTEVSLNLDVDHGGKRENQLVKLKNRGVFTGGPKDDLSGVPHLVNPYDVSGEIEPRVRSYLHVNCSPCHVEAGGGNARMNLEFSKGRGEMQLIDARPIHDSFGLTNAMLVSPGKPGESVLLHRLSKRGPGQMPPLVTTVVDDLAVALFREWIGGLKPERAFVRNWTMTELMSDWGKRRLAASETAGRELFRSLGCVQCHRAEGAGGAVGPDLTGVASRLDRRALLESVLEPSKLIADEFATYEIELRDGEVISGRVERETEADLIVRTGSAVEPLVRVVRKDVAHRRKSTISNMPAGMLNVLEKEQALELLSYAYGL